MSYLLLPADEDEMVKHLCVDLGWNMVTGRMERGTPIVFSDRSVALSEDLPVAGDHAMGPLWACLFWSPEWGRPVAVGDAPEPEDVVRRVLRGSLGRDTTELDNVVDPHMSPVLIYKRCHWQDRRDGSLAVGFLRGMDRPRSDWPPQLRQGFRQAERWLKRGAVKINPFDYVDEPRTIANVTTWARPAAWSWIERGGRIANAAF
jgi:hypothetical protein